MNKEYARLRTHIIDTAKFDIGITCFGMWTWGLCYANNQKTDGIVPAVMLKRADPDFAKITLAVTELVARGLWEELDGDYRIVDFEEHACSLAEIEARREAGRKGGILSSKQRKKKSPKSSVESDTSKRPSSYTDTDTDTKTDTKILSDNQKIVGAWMEAYKAAHGSLPVVGGRNNKAAKDLLAAVGLVVALRCIENAFADNWFRTATSCDLFLIASQVNKYSRETTGQPQGGASAFYRPAKGPY